MRRVQPCSRHATTPNENIVSQASEATSAVKFWRVMFVRSPLRVEIEDDASPGVLRRSQQIVKQLPVWKASRVMFGTYPNVC